MAQRWVAALSRLKGSAGLAEQARAMLAAWDGRLDPQAAEPLLYSCFRRELSRLVLEPILGPRTWEWLIGAGLPPVGKLVRRWTDAVIGEDPGGFESETASALERAWQTAAALAGPDSNQWHYGEHHLARPTHPLSARAATGGVGGWNPQPVPMGGDADTVQAAAYSPNPAAPFDVTNLSVYRQVVDMASPDRGTWVIPGGASGDPTSPHFADQLPVWADHRRLRIRPD